MVSNIGSMNTFIVLKTDSGMELVTPALDGTILPGVTRQSVIELANARDDLSVSERDISMSELIEAFKAGRYTIDILYLFISIVIIANYFTCVCVCVCDFLFLFSYLLTFLRI